MINEEIAEIFEGMARVLVFKGENRFRKIGLVERADIAGSIRRRRETIGDLDVLIISRDSPCECVKLLIVKQKTEVVDLCYA